MTRLEPARGLAARGEMPGGYAHLAEAIAALRAARVPRRVAEARARHALGSSYLGESARQGGRAKTSVFRRLTFLSSLSGEPAVSRRGGLPPHE